MRRKLLLVCTLLACPVLAACASGMSRHSDAVHLLHDDAFPDHSDYTVESRGEVFHLDREAQNYLDRNINSIRDLHKRRRALIEELFDKAAMNLSYDSHANTTASETFHNRAANCLSMSILAYSMAEYVGFSAKFQEVHLPDYWERRDRFSLMNRHINLRLTPKTHTGTMLVKRNITLEVDFQPLVGVSRTSTRTISPLRALAMFYNNKAIDALLDGNADKAYAYLRAAILQDPSLDMAYTNLGLLYARNGHEHRAEESYRQAIAINRNNSVAGEHLATLLMRTGREAEAQAILARIESRRKYNPYYAYILGEEAYDAGRWREAVRHFERATRLKSDIEVFYLGLAKSHYRLGNTDKAEAYRRRAEQHSPQAESL